MGQQISVNRPNVLCGLTVVRSTGKATSTAAVKTSVIIFGGLFGSVLKV